MGKNSIKLIDIKVILMLENMGIVVLYKWILFVRAEKFLGHDKYDRQYQNFI